MDKKLKIEETKNTPSIHFDGAQGVFKIKGRSFPENAKKFYKPIIEWLVAFSPEDNKTYHVYFALDYVSSSSLLTLLEIMKQLNTFHTSGYNFEINWQYDFDDEDIKKIGEDFKKFLQIPIHFEEV